MSLGPVRVGAFRLSLEEFGGFFLRSLYTASGFLTSLLLAQFIAPAELGRYFEALAWAMLLLSFVQAGIVNHTVRDIAALRARADWVRLRGTAVLASRIIAAGAVLAALLLAGWGTWVAPADERLLYWLAAPVALSIATSTVRQAVVRGLGWPLRGQLVDSLVRPGVQLSLLALATFGVVRVAPSAEVAMAIMLAATLAGGAVAWAVERAALLRLTGRGERRAPPWREFGGSLARNATIGWFSAVNGALGVLVLGWLGAQADVAVFRIMQQLSMLMSFGLLVAVSLYGHRLSHAHTQGDRADLQAVATRTCTVATVTALPLAVIFIVGGGWLVPLAYGPDYASGYPLLIVLTLGQLANNLFGATTLVAISTHNEGMAVRAYWWATVANVAVCAVLVPRWGAMGAAIGLSSCFVVWNTMLFLGLRSRLGITTLPGRQRQTVGGA